MKSIALCIACIIGISSAAQGADLLSGTWTTGAEPTTRIYVFKVSGDRFTGIVCGPCDNPSSVFRIEDGRMHGADRATFFIRYDGGGPAFNRYGPYRERVEASVARNRLQLSGRPENDAGATASSASLARVVENFELAAVPLPAAPPSRAQPAGATIEGHWVSVGRTAQQNWILKVTNGEVWGLVCGPCTPAVVAMLDEGRVAGNTVTFFINHIDTPPDGTRQGIQRNVMTGTLGDTSNPNVMRFKWIREQSPEQSGEILMMGPLR